MRLNVDMFTPCNVSSEYYYRTKTSSFQVNEHTQLTDRFWFLRRPTQFMADVAVLCGAFFVAYLPAVNVQLGEFYDEVVVRQLPFVVLVQFSSLFLVGAYSILWRYVSIEDLKPVISPLADDDPPVGREDRGARLVETLGLVSGPADCHQRPAIGREVMQRNDVGICPRDRQATSICAY